MWMVNTEVSSQLITDSLILLDRACRSGQWQLEKPRLPLVGRLPPDAGKVDLVQQEMYSFW
jgi:hypothetical protein